MLKYKVGDITKAPENIIAHGCNAQGVMGKGVAKAIKEAFPYVYLDYRLHYEQYGLSLGDVIYSLISEDRWVANCITQKYYAIKSQVQMSDAKIQYVDYNAIRQCMKSLRKQSWSPTKDLSIALPKIGSALGGGDWSVISKIIDEELGDLDVTVYVLNESEIPRE